MFSVLLVKELKDHLMTFRFSVATITIFLLTLTSFWVMSDDYNRRKESIVRLKTLVQEQNEEAVAPSQLEPSIYKEPSPLSILVQGEEKRLGDAVIINRWEVPGEATERLGGNFLNSNKLSFDLSAIVTMIVSLFAILFSYSAISEERERGTLKLLCICNPSRSIVYLSKFLGATLALSIPVLLSLVLGFIFLEIYGGIPFAVGHWMAIVLMIAGILLYIAIYICIGMLTSTLSRRSSFSLIFSLFIWVLTVMLVPIASKSIGQSFMEVEPKAAIKKIEDQTTKQNVARSVELLNELTDVNGLGEVTSNMPMRRNKTGAYAPVVYEAYPGSYTVAAKFFSRYEIMWQESADDIWQVVKSNQESKTAQVALIDALASISPSHHLDHVLSSLSGTSFENHQRFIDAARRQRRQFLTNLKNKDYFDGENIGFFAPLPREEAFREDRMMEIMLKIQSEEISAADFPFIDQYVPLPEDLMPDPGSSDYNEPDPGATLPGFAILILMLAGLFAAGRQLFINYDVR